MAGKPPSASTVNIKSHERSYSIMFSKKKTECRVCGYRFTPERENIYTAEEPRSMADMLTKAPTRFSAVDCPVCGCQIRLADRAPRIDLPAITEQHDADAEETEGGDRQDGEMLFVLHTGNGRAFTKLGSRRRGILQSALRTRDRQVGSKGFQGSAGGGIRLFCLSQRGRIRHIFTITFTGKRKSASCAGGYGSRTTTGTPPIQRPSLQW